MYLKIYFTQKSMRVLYMAEGEGGVYTKVSKVKKLAKKQHVIK